MRVRRLLIPFAGAGAVYVLVARGALTLDLGWGRHMRPLGPMLIPMVAPPEVVFDVIAAPYLGRTPRAMQQKLRVLERGSDMVLAAHYTPVGWLGVTTTVETVRFTRPTRIDFRLLRGPVPHIVETFELRAVGAGTELEYRGELGTDLWALGRWWGERVAGPWERIVERSLQAVRVEAERLAASRTSNRRAEGPESISSNPPGAV
jgi:polyketide cyclase/dehydrase/lipid transport protein